MIKAATLKLEAYVDQKFIAQTWAQYMDCWPVSYKETWWDGVRDMPVSELYSQSGSIEIMAGPLRSVTEFNTYTDSNVAILLPSSQYVVDLSNPVGRVALPLGGTWPATILKKNSGIEIKFVAGISDNAAGVPSEIKQAVLEYVAALYENRGDLDANKIPVASMALLENYRRFKAGGKYIV
jgi:uncharacterized phiE125 gp8 family phage protein